MKTVPLDRLYDFLDIIANADTIIYLFRPHGSKDLAHCQLLHDYNLTKDELMSRPIIICHDQEPLNWDLYSDNHDVAEQHFKNFDSKPAEIIDFFANLNLRSAVKQLSNTNDLIILTHSERNSNDLEQYTNNGYAPVFVWSHALIARDWFRYAYSDPVLSNAVANKSFLLYARDYTGSRAYRKDFVDSVKQHGLGSSTVFSDPNTHSDYSADYNNQHYANTAVEVVLETVIDRVHLTEKTLRPIACGKPFLLMAGAHSLDFLKDYGFRTYENIFGHYDSLSDTDRQQAIIDYMIWFDNLMPRKRVQVYGQMLSDARFNKQRFFSDRFFDRVIAEYKSNLMWALEECKKHQGNTVNQFHELCKQHKEYKRFVK